MCERAKKSSSKPKSIDVNDVIKIKDYLSTFHSGKVLNESDVQLVEMASALINNLIQIQGLWHRSQGTVKKLLRKIFGNSSEKSSKILGKSNSKSMPDGGEKNPSPPGAPTAKNGNHGNPKKDDKPKRKGGGGKNGADDYTSAVEVQCQCKEWFVPGKICPQCNKNKLFEIDPKRMLRLIGNPPVTALVFIIQQLRCICGASFIAPIPDAYSSIFLKGKYSPSALASITISKYLMGVPFGTLARIQEMNGIPLPASTQANMIKKLVLPALKAIAEILKYLAANSYAIGFDDTKILTLQPRQTVKGGETLRGDGTAIVANGFDSQDHSIILFDFDFTKHAGNVVIELLKDRLRKSLPLLIADGLEAYKKSKGMGVDVGCNVHARRKAAEEDPKGETYLCYNIIDCYSNIYMNDAFCKKENMSDVERMEYHSEHSRKYFYKIKILYQIVTGVPVSSVEKSRLGIPETLVADEPNGPFTKMANYFLSRYESLTAVMSVPGAPLDTNYVERVIKLIIKIRKMSLFFHNPESAKYSGQILSVLATAYYAGVNVFHYLEFLLENSEKVIANPKYFLPWIYDLDESEKKKYWENVDAIIQDPANSVPISSFEHYHSSG